jgi:zinc protease
MRQRGCLRRFARQGFGLVASFAFLAALAATPAEAMDIKRVTSPGGIEAWLVESHANPLIAMRFAFRGGAAQDPEDKQGLAYFVSGMMDEGAGELDSVAFQERLQTLAMRVDFDAGRDVMLAMCRC